MGTIASVLQWTCTNCNFINPTECLKCIKCGNVRKTFISPSPSSSKRTDEKISNSNGDGCYPYSSNSMNYSSIKSKFNAINNITKNENLGNLHQILPGYVEINTNG